MRRLPLFQTISLAREFFKAEDFLETPTPPIVHSPGMEAHLSPFKVHGTSETKPLFLHTSPEFSMKELLSVGHERIYSLGYCFRDEPKSETHRPQFLMLEWYRANTHYTEIKKDTLKLIEFVRLGLKNNGHKVKEESKPVFKTVEQLFNEILNISLFDFFEVDQIKQLIKDRFPELTSNDFLKTSWPWEDYFFLLFLNKIEPHFCAYDILVVDEFPAPLAALSTLKPEDTRVCERFEIYLSGIELCNCFNELTDLPEQRKRFEQEKAKRKQIYNEEMPEPKVLFNALERGIPHSAGVALGVERLLLGLSVDENFNPFFN